ncbi:MAG: MAPEG family protein [Formosimonas sp.]
MLFAHWMVLLASLLPMLSAAVGKSVIAKTAGGYDNRQPRAQFDAAAENSVIKRLGWAQDNSWEALMMFAPAVLLATHFGVAAATLNALAGVFIIARLTYVWCYAKNLATARSLVWAVGLICVVWLYIASALA